MRTRYLLILAAVIFVAAGYVDHLDRRDAGTVDYAWSPWQSRAYGA